jgi:ABC-type multidrug transport system fused ATPase/permease subunit
VLDDGNLLEFDTPEALLSNPDSRFSELIANAALAGQEK